MTNKKKKKVALILSAGGARGIALAGVLKAFEEEKIETDLIIGVSVGSIIGAMYLYYGKSHIVADKIMHANFRDFIDISYWRVALLPFSKNALCKGFNIHKLLQHQLPDVDISEMKKLVITVTDLTTLTAHYLDKGNLITALESSTAAPPYFSPIVMGDNLFIDGAIADPMPVQEARNRGADIVIVADLSNKSSQFNMQNMLEISYRCLDSYYYAIVQEKIKDADVVIKINHDAPSFVNPTQREELFEDGYKNAKESVSKIRELLNS